jgi:hypothetical protein
MAVLRVVAEIDYDESGISKHGAAHLAEDAVKTSIENLDFLGLSSVKIIFPVGPKKPRKTKPQETPA